MSWKELKMRGGDTSELKNLLHETMDNLEDICDMVEDMEGDDDYGERGGMNSRRSGMRRAYRVIQDDGDDYGERRGSRGRRH